MSEEDDANYRKQLSEVLNKFGFGWIVEQAETQIAEGKTESKQVSERESVSISLDSMFAIQRPRSRRSSLITSEPYTEKERLEILLQAIEAAIVQRSMLEQTILDQFADVSSIEFVPDRSVEESEDSYLGVPHSLNQRRRPVANELEKEARIALDRMRGRASGSTS